LEVQQQLKANEKSEELQWLCAVRRFLNALKVLSRRQYRFRGAGHCVVLGGRIRYTWQLGFVWTRTRLFPIARVPDGRPAGPRRLKPVFRVQSTSRIQNEFRSSSR
jgi:hypothetical protein